MKREFTILIEEDYASNNVSAYVPELRLSVVGDTEEEVISCATDLINMKLEKKPKIFSSKIVSIQIESPEVSNSFILSSLAV